MKTYQLREDELFQLGLKYIASLDNKHGISEKKWFQLAQQIGDFCEWVQDNKKSMDKVEPITQKPFHN